MKGLRSFVIRDELGDLNSVDMDSKIVASAICSRFQRKSLEVFKVDDFGFEYIIDMTTIHRSGDWEVSARDCFAFDSKHEMLRFVARNTGCYKNIQAMVDGYGLAKSP